MKDCEAYLEQLRDELEFARWGCGSCGLAIVRSPWDEFLGRAAWDYCGRLAASYYERIVEPEKTDAWADPAPDGRWCIRWWGSPQAVEEFQKWADKASVLLLRFPELMQHKAVRERYYGTIEAFVSLAAKTPDLKSLIKRRTFSVDEFSTFLAQWHGFPTETPSTPLEFTLIEVRNDALSFAAAVLDHQLANPLYRRLSVDEGETTKPTEAATDAGHIESESPPTKKESGRYPSEGEKLPDSFRSVGCIEAKMKDAVRMVHRDGAYNRDYFQERIEKRIIWVQCIHRYLYRIWFQDTTYYQRALKWQAEHDKDRQQQKKEAPDQ
jgi:hypothetical protein